MEIGRVTSVYYEDGITYCDVRAYRDQITYDGVPVLKTHSSMMFVPKQGMKVTMEQLRNGTRFISNVMAKESTAPESMREGEVAIQLDSGSQIYFEEQNNGDYDLHLGASGDVYINGTKQ